MMRKTIFGILMVLALAGCGVEMPQGEAQQVFGGDVTRVPAATGTPLPTATIGYQATAAVAETARVAAEGTSVAAARLMVEATAAHEARLQDQMRLTAEAEQRSFAAFSWTATARFTSVPATQTQQAIQNTQIAGYQTMTAGQLTATYIAPTQVVALAWAEAEAETALWRSWMEVFAMGAVGLSMMGLTGFVFWKWKAGLVMVTPAVEGGDEVHEMDVTHVKTVDRSGGNLKIDWWAVPCSPDALTEFAQGILSGSKTLAINHWEGAASEHFSRESIKAMRNWMQGNSFALSVGGGVLALTDRSHVGEGRMGGREFLTSWLEHRALPDGYLFGANGANHNTQGDE
jgi:hypothetical protein